MIDGFMDEYGILVILAMYAMIATWPIWLAFFLAILIFRENIRSYQRSMLKGEKNE
jgi:biopolymer transport protein ExbB/TolQ